MRQSIALRLFVCNFAPPATMDLIRGSVEWGRQTLQRYGIGIEIEAAGFDAVGTLDFTGNLVGYGGLRIPSDERGALAAREEIRAKGLDTTSACIVIFGQIDPRLRGHTLSRTSFPPFCCVGGATGVQSTMLHEVVHCAGGDHSMAIPEGAGRMPWNANTSDLMAEVENRKADRRTDMDPREVSILMRSAFYRGP